MAEPPRCPRSQAAPSVHSCREPSDHLCDRSFCPKRSQMKTCWTLSNLTLQTHQFHWHVWWPQPLHRFPDGWRSHGVTGAPLPFLERSCPQRLWPLPGQPLGRGVRADVRPLKGLPGEAAEPGWPSEPQGTRRPHGLGSVQVLAVTRPHCQSQRVPARRRWSACELCPAQTPFRVSRRAGAVQRPDGLSGEGQSLALRCLPLPW